MTATGSVAGFAPVRVGSVRGAVPSVPPVAGVEGRVRLRYPNRLNAMALDPSKVLPGAGSYPAGELVFVTDLFTSVEIQGTASGDGVEITADSARPVLGRHAALLMRQVLGLTGGMRITIRSHPLPPHVGLGSSSAVLAAVAAAINELCGRPLDHRTLMRLLVDNHGEEIDGNDDEIMPVQCIGGSAAAGLVPGAIQVVSGNAVALLAAPAPAGHTIVLAVPPDLRSWDASESLRAEAENFDGFLETGRRYAPQIAYRLLHECWPDLVTGTPGTLGQLVFDYRFEMGSIRNCAFSHPRLLEYAAQVRQLFESGQAAVLSLSSVGPLFFALTEQPDAVAAGFEAAGLTTFRAMPWDQGYLIDECTVKRDARDG